MNEEFGSDCGSAGIRNRVLNMDIIARIIDDILNIIDELVFIIESNDPAFRYFRVAAVMINNCGDGAIPINGFLGAQCLNHIERFDFRNRIHENLHRVAVRGDARNLHEIADIVTVVSFWHIQ